MHNALSLRNMKKSISTESYF